MSTTRERPVEQRDGLLAYVPGWDVLRRYERSWLPKDVVAGLVLSALLVPQGMAYAELAGLPPVTGLYTSDPVPARVCGVRALTHPGAGPGLFPGPDDRGDDRAHWRWRVETPPGPSHSRRSSRCWSGWS